MQHHAHHEDEALENVKEFPFTDKDFQAISQLITGLTGIVLKYEKKTLVYSRLAKRLRSLKMGSFSQYCKYLESPSGKGEISFLINAITTNLTRFFREEHHFHHMRDVVIPSIVERYRKNPTAENRRVRFWSAGCSSGEEPYSLAMTLAAHMPAGFDVKILATDIDTNMLQKGKNGLYKDGEGIPTEYLKRFCSKNADGTLQMERNIRDLIIFNPLNLLHQWPMHGPFQSIFCRNVVIYFNKETQMEIFNKMAALLDPKGWLFIGHSESLFKVCDAFVLKGKTTYTLGTQS